MRPHTITRHIFIEFAHRDGISRSDAADEFDNYLTANGHAVLKDFYLTVRRTGARLVLTRARRAALYCTFENAQNHAWAHAWFTNIDGQGNPHNKEHNNEQHERYSISVF